MNFFEQQERARTRTGLLVLLFALAIVCLIGATCVLVAITATAAGPAPMQPGTGAHGLVNSLRALPRETVTGISGLVIFVVGVAALFKFTQLSGGGSRVAEALGGRLLNPNTHDADEKRLLNVVEEMAIAAGVPVPPVYLLDEAGINAFAAGTTPQNAAIGITRGAIAQLDRDELQGVIAHEFSHIFNGDMRLNLRLIGALHGILVLGTIGYYLMRSASRGARVSRNSRDNGAMPLLFVGGGLMLIGYAGTFFGNLIKAAVSRQREYLADASAVQFTRNPFGIGGALKKIGGFGSDAAGSKLSHPAAGEFSHMFFGQAVGFFFNNLFATHPPLNERIHRIDPNWQAESVQRSANNEAAAARKRNQHASPSDDPAAISAFAENPIATGSATSPASQQAAASSDYQAVDILESAGHISRAQVEAAVNIKAALPADILTAAHEPYAARALVCCLLLDRDQLIRDRQFAVLQAHCDKPTYQSAQYLYEQVRQQERRHLEILDLAMPALKQMSESQLIRFDHLIAALIRVDNKIELLEWSLYNVLLLSLRPSRVNVLSPKRTRNLLPMPSPLACVLSVIAYAGVYESLYESSAPSSERGERAVLQSFEAARRSLQLEQIQLVPRSRVTVDQFIAALAQLARTRPSGKQRILKALLAVTLHDREVRPLEMQLLRAIALSLNCPLPPVDSPYK
ncbi:MAG: hypothetical protein EX270_02325 [Pseudomonadales bacterium]|nr:MAG: hypothetical protein EX270_02325 [Pseudomonadales bacterium]